MKILKNISIKYKLYFIVLVPMCIVFYTSFIEIYNKNETLVKTQKSLSKSILNNKITSLVNALQKERGMSGGYVTSLGKDFKNIRTTQMRLTNQKHQELIEYLHKFHSNNELVLLENLERCYKTVVDFRNKVTKLEVEVSELNAFYSMKINLLLSYIYDSAKETNNIALNSLIYSYANLLFAKEKSAIERLLVTKIIISNEILEKEKINLNNLILLRKVNIKYFKKFLDDHKLIEKYNIMIQKSSYSKVRSIEKKLLRGDLDLNIDARKWFELMTVDIEEQHKYSQILSEKIIDFSNEIESEIREELLKLFLINVIILIVFFIFVIYFYSDISRRFDDIVSSISFISQNDLSQYKRIEIKANDELSIIATKFNEMVDELQVRENKNNQITIDLLKSNQKVEKSNKIKSEFLANMSHEIRTPLNAIVGFIELLKDDELDSKKRNYLSIVQNSSKNLLELINNILDFSKIENSKIVMEYRDIDIIDELKSIVDLFLIQVKEKNINFIVDIDSDLPKNINTDNVKLRQVLINILGNAIKFTKEFKTIVFEVKYIGKRIYFSIKDEGIGIQENKLGILFEPFLQADNSTTREYGGTGLGLAISSRFVEALGGKLCINSEYGKGSEFYFDVPVKSVENVVSPRVKTKVNEQLNGKILLVEDNKPNQLFMKVILKKMGLSFEIANDGLEAVAMFKQNKYDIILMDENMPNMTGIEATKEILEFEKNENLKHTPIVALTANALVGDKTRFLEAGMDEYIAKPVNKEILFSIIEKFLDSVYHEEMS